MTTLHTRDAVAQVLVRACEVHSAWADSPDLPQSDPLAEPPRHVSRESSSVPVPGPFDSPIVFKPPATESGTPEMGTPTKLVFMSLQDDDNLAAASAELHRQQREEAVNGRVSARVLNIAEQLSAQQR